MDKKAKQSSALVIFLCWAAYTVAYLGRLNFNAYIEPIREQIGAHANTTPAIPSPLR